SLAFEVCPSSTAIGSLSVSLSKSFSTLFPKSRSLTLSTTGFSNSIPLRNIIALTCPLGLGCGWPGNVPAGAAVAACC
ncbi:hypothetical protein A2U01_0096014, partial [Trifolium medium]|nr:hypothetical protein [Trifolium medium]